MMLNPVVLLFDPKPTPRADGVADIEHAAGLEAHGFTVYSCQNAKQIYDLAQLGVNRHALAPETAPPGPGRRKSTARPAGSGEVRADARGNDEPQNPILAGAPVLVVLNGPLIDNCSIALYMRTLHPQIRIMALVESFDEMSLIRVLQSGADGYCLNTASTRLLAVNLFVLLRRYSPAHAAAYFDPAARPEGSDNRKWALRDQAWILASPSGESVPLTTVERAFMLALFGAPDLRATHAELLTAINANYASESLMVRQGRLGVIVSRMRRKFHKYGLMLPLKSVHNWGYMFSGNV